ncbi:hypothetical protein F2Q69_00000710 [Brassica cretica]|uniref:Uncharacterized protein n=1 Tax=Brassica cretica TaxID=69181 RepID=A0A8S9P670_BRACR|nr:hypothetical protein F2Q69_00000710 [Brassica cretica]
MEGLPQPPSVWRCVSLFVLDSLLGGSLYSSAVAGSCSRGVEALLAPRHRHMWPLSMKAFGGFGYAGVVVVGSGCPERWRRWF